MFLKYQLEIIKKVFHEEFDVFTVKCSIDHETFNKAYEKASSKFNFRLRICSIYTGNHITDSLLLDYKNKYNVDHWLGNKDSIIIECKLITKELIEDIYGKDYYDLDVSEPDYDLTL